MQGCGFWIAGFGVAFVLFGLIGVVTARANPDQAGPFLFLPVLGFIAWTFFCLIMLALPSQRKADNQKAVEREYAIELAEKQRIREARPTQAISQSLQSLVGFRVSTSWAGTALKNSRGVEALAIAFDENQLKIALLEYNRSTDEVNTRIFDGKDLIEATVEEFGYLHSETVIKTSSETKTHTSGKSMVGRAVVGGVLLGPAGAIIGGATAQKIGNGTTTGSQSTTQIEVVTEVNLKIMVDDPRNPLFWVNFLRQPSSKNSVDYRSAVESATYWHGVVRVLKHRAN